MERDLRFYREAEEGQVAPLLRVYTWKPWAVSLGRAQDPQKALDSTELARRGWDQVKRPTGGRAVLHANELTYSLIAPLTPPFGDNLASTHRLIAGALMRFYRGMDLAPTLSRPASSARLDPRLSAPCFVAPGLAELEIGGRKIAGSAQLRGRGAFLQHGSLPLGPEHLDLALILPGSAEDRAAARDDLAARSVSLGELIDPLPAREELIGRLIEAFAAEFGVSWL